MPVLSVPGPPQRLCVDEGVSVIVGKAWCRRLLRFSGLLNGGRRMFTLLCVATVALVEQSLHGHADGPRRWLGALRTKLHHSAAGTGPAEHRCGLLHVYRS